MPSTTGISTSSVTTSGSSAWIFSSASCPARAVPITVNSGNDAMRSLMIVRMNALSSTTSTDQRLEDTITVPYRAHIHASRPDVEVDRTPDLAANELADHRHPGLRQRRARRGDVALADRPRTVAG